jgi:hypothetical protein
VELREAPDVAIPFQVDGDGTIYGWYHNEPGGICSGGKLTAPRIGAVVSYDGGDTFFDLGLVLSSGDPPDCNAKNGFFAGGHGDFSVILDRDQAYFSRSSPRR